MDQELRDRSSSRDLETEASRMGRGESCSSCSIEVDCNQRACRICHLSSMESGVTTAELIELGCGCKGELGVAHLLCAEAWFKVKGDRLCEICGVYARNVSGVCDNRFMEEWNEGRWIDRGNSFPFCNLLMACLVVAFILPWFFHVNLI